MNIWLRMVLALYFGFFLHTLLIFLLGSSGVFGYGELLFHKAKLNENLAELREINAGLLKERDALLYDNSEIELRARTLGYRRENEIRIKIPNNSRMDYYRTLGALVRRNTRNTRDYGIFGLIALCGAGILYAGLTLTSRARSGYKKA